MCIVYKVLVYKDCKLFTNSVIPDWPVAKRGMCGIQATLNNHGSNDEIILIFITFRVGYIECYGGR